jgi:hypothetical protein
MASAGRRGIDQRNTTNLDLLVEANLDLLMDALSPHYCHSVGVRKLESSGKQMAHKDTGTVQRIILPVPQEVRRLSFRVHPVTERKDV